MKPGIKKIYRLSNLIFFLAFFLSLSVILGASSNSEQKSPSDKRNLQNLIFHLEEPSVIQGDKLIRHKAYSLVYDTGHRLSKWVAYSLSDKHTDGPYKRGNIFMVDPDLALYTDNSEDYRGSGYDRGHLAPAADMKWSEMAMVESFYYSNMAPQLPAFNRGIWSRLETQVREWANKEHLLYIVSGPILKPSLNRIGKNKIAVPKFFYKALLAYDPPHMKGIAFLLENEESRSDLEHYSLSIDSLEHLTGLDFFPLLPDNQEKDIEEKLCKECWFSDVIKPLQSKVAEIEGIAEIQQCKGKTSKGSRCIKNTTNKNGYCHFHTNQAKPAQQ